MLVFCLRSLAEDAAWVRAERWIRTGFWGLNAGLALMMAIDLFPAGVLQLWDVLQNGYWHARRLTYLMSRTFHMLEWARSFADGIFLVVGVVPIVVAVEVLLESDVAGSLVQDCEVCCNPWLLRVSGRDEERRVDVSRADGSE